MHTTHRELCDKAKTILTEYLASPTPEGQKFDPVQHETIGKLIELFDGPAQREADKHSPVTLHDFQRDVCRTLPEPGVNHWFDMPAPTSAPWSVDDALLKRQQLFKMRIDLLHAILGIAGESGEGCDPVKKSMFYGKALDVENIKEEAGDLLWYIAGPLCRALGCTLEELARANVAKLQKRYPDKYSDQAAIARADKQ